ncbi:hypothetical protein SCLCIDRAFT_272558 [Scleroderma citrinum Foug A]|uniref:Uncharacterized protein n=1 Tax=Scleroderma citrinum Foug A TaxID=1036808 RepID=A0A0C3D5D8_9AGAM|nr:hypothetical protein SCLCIDRAFT_272558 [Scleroderma citrinum Foug A]
MGTSVTPTIYDGVSPPPLPLPPPSSSPLTLMLGVVVVIGRRCKPRCACERMEVVVIGCRRQWRAPALVGWSLPFKTVAVVVVGRRSSRGGGWHHCRRWSWGECGRCCHRQW